MHLSILLECILWKIAVKFMVLTVTHAKPENQIAFVFAGSVRSFTSPQVYGSLKANLIESFCPPEHCVSDIFFRLSKTDNVHGGPYSKGQLISEEYGVISKLKIALDYLNQSAHSWNGVMKVNWVDIGSDLEHQQIVNEFKSLRHKIFRELDSRRYSMNFNRYRAYQMAIETEKKMGYRYSWVVHARLDSAWGEPLRPYHCWPSSKIWVQDTWHCTVPDTFALLPRHLSDQYYSMDLLVSEGVMCLGGPNFGEESLSDESLARLGFQESEIKTVKQSRCEVVHPEHMIIHESGERNDSWSWAGVSEIILMRKLKRIGIERDKNTLGFAQLFVVVVRSTAQGNNMSPLCFFLQPHRMFPFLEDAPFDFHSQSSALHSGCLFMLTSHTPLSPPPLTPYHITPPHTVHKPYSRMVSTEATICRANGGSDSNIWNFMPFRLKFINNEGSNHADICVTATKYVQTDDTVIRLNVSQCVDIIWNKFRKLELYSISQMFHFHPIHNLYQPIKYTDQIEQSDRIWCLTISPKKHTATFRQCVDRYRRAQSFRVHFFRQDDLKHQQMIWHEQQQNVQVLIYWSKKSNMTVHDSLCFCSRLQSLHLSHVNRSRIAFMPCREMLQSKVSGAACTLTLERTVSSGPVVSSVLPSDKDSSASKNMRLFSHYLTPTWTEFVHARQTLPAL